MAGYIHFTDEQKQRANSVDLVDFLRRQGEQLTRSGREWRWNRHDSVTVRGNQWFRHSSRQGGLAIDFVQEFYGLPFPDAVTLLLNGEQGMSFRQSDKKTMESERKEFLLPEAADTMRRVYAYLLKQRYIDRDVLTHFVREKKIFEDREYHNAVFVGFDEKGTTRHAHKRGTYSNAGSYRGNVEGSDPKYSFNHIGTGDTLYVFEAPIDMLSYISLHQRNWQQHSYVTLDGVAEHAMLHVLSQNRHLDNVVLCLDHDPAGIEAMGRLTEMLRERRYDRISCLQSTFKDWNEDLKAQHGVTPVPAQGHPKIEACREVCGELIELCSSVKSTRKPYEMLMEHYEKFSFLTQNEKVMFGKDAAVTEHLQSMSAYALLAVQEQYRQLEQPVKIEHLADELYKSYYPHQDRDRLRTKTDNLQRDITAINDQVHSVGIRTPGDKQKLISSYMSLALNCVKAHIFLVIEGQTQKTEVQQKRNTNQIDCEQVVCEKPAQPQYNLS
jgi:hypothetical protein